MKIEKIKDGLTAPIKGEIQLVGYWPSAFEKIEAVPVFHVSSTHAFNQVVGYAKFINGSNGTVLYRGQCNNHDKLLPSGAREGYLPVSDSIVDTLLSDDSIKDFFGLNHPDIKGREKYQNVLMEAILQHYGANTYCMDFVDNHWVALWFGLYKYKRKEGCYIKRNGAEEKLYIYLYLADTNSACVRGMYVGGETYTVDLRKALPSTVSRPIAQHGWIVRKHNREKCDYNDRVIGVIEIDVDVAAKWLGEGELLSQNNFFPDYLYDQGYRILLGRQIRSGVPSSYPKILPANTICNYYYRNNIYSSGRLDNFKSCITIKGVDDETITSVPGLYTLLLEKGWNENTCSPKSVWDEENPVVGQSLVTALIVHMCFGGEILYFKYAGRTHHFNCIDEIYIDLAVSELESSWKKKMENKQIVCSVVNASNTYRKHRNKVNALIQNCGVII